jgi:hypothetical protein
MPESYIMLYSSLFQVILILQKKFSYPGTVFVFSLDPLRFSEVFNIFSCSIRIKDFILTKASHKVTPSQSHDFDFDLTFFTIFSFFFYFILIKKWVPTAQKCAKSVKYYLNSLLELKESVKMCFQEVL